MDRVAAKKLKDFFSEYKEVSYNKGQILVQPDDAVSKINLLVSGKVKLYSYSPTGEEIAIHIFKPLVIFPIALVLAGSQNKFYFEALTSVEVKKAPVEKVLPFIKKNPEILLDLNKRFAKAIFGLVTRIEQYSSTRAFVRVCSVLVYLAENFGEKEKNGTTIKLKLAHKDLAAWTGLTRETVSRQLSLLKSKRIMSYSKRHLVIIDTDQLKKEAN